EASDGPELVALATRHPQVRFILAHIGGGGDWEHSLAALRATPNVYVDLSGSGVDGGMLEACLEAAGVERLLWGTDLTMDTGWARRRTAPPPPRGAIRCTMGSTRQGPRCGSSQRRAVRRTCHS